MGSHHGATWAPPRIGATQAEPQPMVTVGTRWGWGRIQVPPSSLPTPGCKSRWPWASREASPPPRPGEWQELSVTDSKTHALPLTLRHPVGFQATRHFRSQAICSPASPSRTRWKLPESNKAGLPTSQPTSPPHLGLHTCCTPCLAGALPTSPGPPGLAPAWWPVASPARQ